MDLSPKKPVQANTVPAKKTRKPSQRKEAYVRGPYKPREPWVPYNQRGPNADGNYIKRRYQKKMSGSKSVSQKLNKYQKFLNEPIKSLNKARAGAIKKLEGMGRGISEKLRAGNVNVVSQRYKQFIKHFNSDNTRMLAKTLPLILLTLTSLFIAHRETFKMFGKLYIENAEEINKIGGAGFVTNINTIIKLWMKILSTMNFTKKIELGSHVIVLLTLFLDEIPHVFTKSYVDLRDINILQLLKRLGMNANEINKIVGTPQKEAEDKIERERREKEEKVNKEKIEILVNIATDLNKRLAKFEVTEPPKSKPTIKTEYAEILKDATESEYSSSPKSAKSEKSGSRGSTNSKTSVTTPK